MPPEKPQAPQIEYEELPNERMYTEEYANNVYYEPSAWDLKLIFGLLDQRHGKNLIRQHTAISLAWPQVKIFSHWLRGYIEFHEYVNGKIVVPSMAIPPEGTPPTAEQKAADPNAEKVYEIFTRLRKELIEKQN
jgi:hypothetical protein